MRSRTVRATERHAAEFAPAHLRTPGAFFWHYLRLRTGQFAALGLLVVLAACCAVVVQYQVKLLVDAMDSANHRTSGAWLAVGTFIGLIAAESILWRSSGWLACRAIVAVGVRMRLDLFAYLSGQSMRYFADNLAGSLGQRITGTAGAFGALTNTFVWRVASPCVDFVGGLVIFTTVDWRMAAAMGIYTVIVTAGLILIGNRGRRFHTAYHAKSSEVAGELVDVISNMWAVKAFTARRREWERLSARLEQEGMLQTTSWMYTERTRFIYDVVMWGMAALMLCWAVHSWSQGRVSPGGVVIVSALTFRILHGSRDVTLALVEATQQYAYMEETLRVIGQVHAVVDPPGAPALVRKSGVVELRDVSFGYDPNRLILDHVSLRIEPGEKIGIVGSSGAGKTTLVHLLQRLYEIGDGEILIDGQSIGSVTQESLSALLSVVPQEISLFHRSVLENIRFARTDASDAEVLAAARAAHCDGFVRRLAEGYETLVGERGVKLSGGQRQRIGIARAFLKDAPIMILDEATSSLDTESELEIQRNIVELLQGRTVIAVAHRLSTLAAFDRVVVLQQGKIVEQGSPAQLRRHGRQFGKMWRLQANGLAMPAEEHFASGPHSDQGRRPVSVEAPHAHS